jgi:siroheme synthase-like protein
MNVFPLFFNLTGKVVVVVGGGTVAERKVRLLLRAGARVTVVAPEQTPWLRASAQAGALTSLFSSFVADHIRHAWLVIAATGRREINRSVAQAAEALHLPCNVVDDGELSTVQVPAMVDRSPLMIAISSAGSAPVLARRVREWIESELPESLGQLAGLLARRRAEIKQAFPEPHTRRQFFDSVLDSPIPDLFAQGKPEQAQRAFETALKEEVPPQTIVVTILPIADLDAVDLLTLRALRKLNQADWVLYLPLILPAILEKARRDARLMPLDQGGVVLQETLLNQDFWAPLCRSWSPGERIVITWKASWPVQPLLDLLRHHGVQGELA